MGRYVLKLFWKKCLGWLENLLSNLYYFYAVRSKSFFLNNLVPTHKILSFGGYVQIRTSDYASVTNQLVSDVVRRQF